jgi:hypothetical protein
MGRYKKIGRENLDTIQTYQWSASPRRTHQADAREAICPFAMGRGVPVLQANTKYRRFLTCIRKKSAENATWRDRRASR